MGTKIGRAVLWVGLVAAGAGGCSQAAYRQVLEEPVHTSPRVELDEESYEVVEARSSGFLWSECARVGEDAVAELYEKARAAGYDALTDVEWWDYRGRAWTRVPQCRREWGWLSAAIYLAWWPTATKVRVRGKAVDRAVVVKAVAQRRAGAGARAFKAVGVGPAAVGKTAAELRRVDDGAVLTAGGFGGEAKGYDLRLGLPEAAEWGFAVEVARTRECCARDGAGRELVGTRGVGLLGQWFLQNSFYVIAGPEVEERAYVWETAERGRREWRERGVALRLGVGNEWRTERGWVYGADWVAVSAPAFALGVVQGSGGDARGNGALRREWLNKMLVLRVGHVL